MNECGMSILSSNDWFFSSWRCVSGTVLLGHSWMMSLCCVQTIDRYWFSLIHMERKTNDWESDDDWWVVLKDELIDDEYEETLWMWNVDYGGDDNRSGMSELECE